MKTHPLEETFEVEAAVVDNFDVVEYEEKEVVTVNSYDEKDSTIDEEFDTVYTKALDAYNSMSEEMEFVEGRYKARVGEVSAQFLNTALNAAKEKMNLKQHKDKLVVKEIGSGVTNNNLFVGSHDELLKVLQDAKGQKDESVE